MTTNSPSPKRGYIWLANFDPTVEPEIKKTRSFLVVSSDFVGKLLTSHPLWREFLWNLLTLK